MNERVEDGAMNGSRGDERGSRLGEAREDKMKEVERRSG